MQPPPSLEHGLKHIGRNVSFAKHAAKTVFNYLNTWLCHPYNSILLLLLNWIEYKNMTLYSFVTDANWIAFSWPQLLTWKEPFSLLTLLYGSCCIIAFIAHLSESAAVRKWGYTTWNSNYKTSGAFNLLLISQQLWWKTLSPINVSKYDPTMSRPPRNPINIKYKTRLKKDVLEL